MNQENKLPTKLIVTGYASLILGMIASLLCIKPTLLFFALLAGLIGMLTSMVYIAQINKLEDTKNGHKIGLISLFLNSVPMISILIMIFMR